MHYVLTSSRYRVCTSALQLVLVELGEFSEDVPLFVFGQAHPTVRDRHTEEPHRIRPELELLKYINLLMKEPSLFSYLVSNSGMTARAEQLAGDAHTHLTISRSKLHLQSEEIWIIKLVDPLIK